MKHFFSLIFILIFSTPTLAKEESKYLCRNNEQVVFGCNINKKIVSLCTSLPLNKSSGYIQYRFGTPNKIEMEYPSNLVGTKDLFKHSIAAFSGGAEGRIRFQNKDYEYIIFDSMQRTNFKADEPNYPAFDSGLFIRHNGKTISLLHCNDKESSIRTGYEFIEEDFNRDLMP